MLSGDSFLGSSSLVSLETRVDAPSNEVSRIIVLKAETVCCGSSSPLACELLSLDVPMFLQVKKCYCTLNTILSSCVTLSFYYCTLNTTLSSCFTLSFYSYKRTP
mmetsp:Transcript_22526/g.53172  ORF Transcript_22526/g.53172 Transcript_22526/m.53172 type:complete len:105 (+) Transcript_22526:4600-4914(+)